MIDDRLAFLESRVTRLEKLLYFVIVLSLPNAFEFAQTLI